MRLIDELRMCLRNLLKRPGRTIMTAAGIVIGTTAVIVMISLGVGLNQAFDGLMSSMGDLTTIYVYSNYGIDDNGQTKEIKIEEKNLQEINQIPHVVGTKATYDLYNKELTIRVDNYVYTGTVIGIDMSSMGQFGYTVESGAFPTENSKEVIMFGPEAVYYFYEYDDDEMLSYRNEMGEISKPAPFDPLTATIEILPSKKTPAKDVDYDAVGMEAQGIDYTDMFENDTYLNDNAVAVTVGGILKADPRDYSSTSAIYMDITLLRELVSEYNEINAIEDPPDLNAFSYAEVKVDDVSNIIEVQSQLGSNDGTFKGMGYQTYSMEDQRKSFQSFTLVIQVVLAGLAGISLLVAAIGISNTMIMSITERTKEIGVMKVLGCSVGNIRSLFLMEAGAIGTLGGVFGVIVSFLLSNVINQIATSYAMNSGGNDTSGFSMLLTGGISIIPVWLVGFALIFGMSIGVISGFYPANRAVKISPLAAIHHD